MTRAKSTKSESDVKRDIVKIVRANGGYARRIEDIYGVGIYDMILIPHGLPVFMAEVKIIRGTTFGPTERQLLELSHITEVGNSSGYVIPVIIGWKEGNYYFHKPVRTVNYLDCFSMTDGTVNFYNQLVQYYHSRRK